MKAEVIPNDNDKEREDGRGRVRVSRRRTWLLVVDGEVFGEYDRKKDAAAAALRKRAAAAAAPSRLTPQGSPPP
jgi:hypothetical protein